ncbi:MAG: hypothetical protein AB1479_09885 [Pseudomonadota bacterium]
MQIILINPHTHAGREHPAGAALDVPHSVAVWLIEQGVARPADAAPKHPRKPRSNPVQTARKEG